MPTTAETGWHPLNCDTPSGTYRVDAFAERFGWGHPQGDELYSYREQLNRLLQIAEVRSRWDLVGAREERKQAAQLLDAVADVISAFEGVLELGNPADLAVRLTGAFAAKNPAPPDPISVVLVQLAEHLNAAREWSAALDKHFKPRAAAPPHVNPRPQHVARLVVKFYERRTKALPLQYRKAAPRSRSGWMADFMESLWLDARLSLPADADNLKYFLGRKLEDVLA